MSAYGGPEINDSGLVLALDAGNTKSYPGYGTAWTNLTGNGLNATIGNSPSFGFSNNGILTYSGSNSGATATGTSSLFNVGTGDFTLECWAKVSSFAPYSLPVSLDDNLNGNGIIYYLAASPNNFRTWIGNTANNSVTQITTNTWYHLVISRLSGTVSKYINGVLDSTHTAAGSLATGQSIKIGWRYDAAYNFTGSIGGVRFYNTALTAAQVAQNYNATAGRYSNLPFSPSDISGLQLWLDASEAKSLFSDTAGTTLATTDGTAIALWKDKSGSIYNGTQATTNNRPTLRTNVLNGYPSLRFDGTDWLNCGDVIEPANTVSIFVVARSTSTGQYCVMAKGGSGNYYNAYGIFFNVSGTNTNATFNTGSVGTTIGLSSSNNTWYTMTGVYNGANIFHRQNGNQTSAALTGNLVYNADNLRIGTMPNAGNSFGLVGDISEVLVYNTALTTTQQQQVEAYLNTKWKVY